MAKLPVNPLSWLEPDRRWLYRGVRALTHRHLTAVRARVVREMLLADLEIYDDPRQGVGSWLFENEEELLASLGEHLQAAEPTALIASEAHPARRTAAVLRDRLEGNGTGRPVRNVR